MRNKFLKILILSCWIGSGSVFACEKNGKSASSDSFSTGPQGWEVLGNPYNEGFSGFNNIVKRKLINHSWERVYETTGPYGVFRPSGIELGVSRSAATRVFVEKETDMLLANFWIMNNRDNSSLESVSVSVFSDDHKRELPSDELVSKVVTFKTDPKQPAFKPYLVSVMIPMKRVVKKDFLWIGLRPELEGSISWSCSRSLDSFAIENSKTGWKLEKGMLAPTLSLFYSRLDLSKYFTSAGDMVKGGNEKCEFFSFKKLLDSFRDSLVTGPIASSGPEGVDISDSQSAASRIFTKKEMSEFFLGDHLRSKTVRGDDRKRAYPSGESKITGPYGLFSQSGIDLDASRSVATRVYVEKEANTILAYFWIMNNRDNSSSESVSVSVFSDDHKRDLPSDELVSKVVTFKTDPKQPAFKPYLVSVMIPMKKVVKKDFLWIGLRPEREGSISWSCSRFLDSFATEHSKAGWKLVKKMPAPTSLLFYSRLDLSKYFTSTGDMIRGGNDTCEIFSLKKELDYFQDKLFREAFIKNESKSWEPIYVTTGPNGPFGPVGVDISESQSAASRVFIEKEMSELSVYFWVMNFGVHIRPKTVRVYVLGDDEEKRHPSEEKISDKFTFETDPTQPTFRPYLVEVLIPLKKSTANRHVWIAMESDIDSWNAVSWNYSRCLDFCTTSTLDMTGWDPGGIGSFPTLWLFGRPGEPKLADGHPGQPKSAAGSPGQPKLAEPSSSFLGKFMEGIKKSFF